MDVASAALECVREYQVDQLYNRGFVRGLLEVSKCQLFRIALQFDVGLVHIGDRLHHLIEVLFLSGPVRLFNSFQNGSFRSHHRLNVEAGHELDIVHGEHIGGINHGNRERGAYSAQRKNLISLGSFVRDQLDD